MLHIIYLLMVLTMHSVFVFLLFLRCLELEIALK